MTVAPVHVATNSTARLIVMTALALAGCPADTADGSDGAARDSASEVRDDAAVDAVTNLFERKASLGYSAARAGLCAGAPADLFGAMVWVDDAALWRASTRDGGEAEPIARWVDGEVASSPMVAASLAPGGASLFVATSRPGHATLRAFDRLGQVVSTFEAAASDCMSPSSVGRLVVWPLGGASDEADGWRVRWIDSEHGVLRDSLLDARPLTTAVSFDASSRSGGGSHWLVGTEAGVTVLYESISGRLTEPDPEPTEAVVGRVGQWVETEGVPSSLVVARAPEAVGRDVPPAFVVLTLGDVDGGDAVALGHRFRILELTQDATGAMRLTSRGPIVEAPGAMTAHPIAIVGCESVAGGGSHWFCPPSDVGAVITAGEGWIAAWGVPSGRPIFQHLTATRWTGLAVGDGGWIAGGGSHWLPGEEDTWSLQALHPGPTGAEVDMLEVELARGDGAACVPSPLWDSDGHLSVPVGGSAPSVVSTVLAIHGRLTLGGGQPRALGGNGNRGARVTEPGRCSDDRDRDLAAAPLTAGAWIGGFVSAGRMRVLWGGDARGGFARRLDDPIGSMREIVIPDAVAVEQLVALADESVVLSWSQVDPDRTARLHVAGHDWSGVPMWEHALDADTIGGGVALVPWVSGRVLLGARTPHVDQLIEIDPLAGVLGSRAFMDTDEVVGLAMLRLAPQGGLLMVLTTQDGALELRLLDAALAEVAQAHYATPGRVVMPDAVTVDGLGVVRAIVENVVPEGGGAARWLRFDAALALVTDRPMPWFGSMATSSDGQTLVSHRDRLIRVGPADAFGTPRVVDSDADFLAEQTVGLGETGFTFAVRREGDDGPEVVWGNADALGFVACGAAGLCLGQPADQCDTAGVCEQAGCVPETGLCAGESIEACVAP